MKKKDLEKKLLELLQKEKSLKQICKDLEMNELKVLSLIYELRSNGINIISKKFDDDIYFVNFGDLHIEENNTYEFKTNKQHEFKFILIADTRLGSKSQQLSILNDILKKGHKMGYNNVILCGNISAGYSNVLDEENFIADTIAQSNYIIENYPKINGMKTYFITGKIDHKHLKNKKINIGKKIAEKRDDMIYLGNNSCNINIDNTKMQVMSSNLAKTYTASYRAQQQIDSFRSEDKPDILLLGGLLQMEKFPYRNVHCITVPSVCATTKEMNEKRYANTVGAWYVTIKTNELGLLDSINCISSPYYVTNKDDYLKYMNSKNYVKKNINHAMISANILQKKYIEQIAKSIKNGMKVDDFLTQHNLDTNTFKAFLQLCNVYGIDLSVAYLNNTLVFRKKEIEFNPIKKLNIDSKKINHSKIGVLSDTHFGNIHNQLHLVNEFYYECYLRGIKNVLHVGDIVDGYYTNRPESPRQQFLHGFDEQAGYVVDMYPEIKGINTYYILGSHDETHYKNGQATINEWISRCRNDMIYLGQDKGEFEINNVKISLDHPGGGSAKALSYQPQRRIEQMESKSKPNILLIGHYHKNYNFLYRNVHCVEVPSLCDTTQFQSKQGIANSLGAYILDIYSDNKGNVQYFEPEAIIYDHKDIWDEVNKDKEKVRKLEIK